MTDRTTELLRKLLDERGVEYEAYRDIKNRCITKWSTYHGAFVFFAVEEEGKLFVETASDTEHSAICTPEQAIAATLGTPISADLRTALDFMRIWITDDAHLGESAISYEFEKAEGLRKLDAIEQAIAATLGAEYHRYEQAAIEAWESIKAWNARATHGTLTAEQVRELIAPHLHARPTFDFGRHGAVWGADFQAIADELNELGSGTCECIAEYAESPIDGKKIVLHRCSACHELMRPYMRYCPNCGARVRNE